MSGKGGSAEKHQVVSEISKFVAGEMKTTFHRHGRTVEALQASLPKRVACQLYAAGYRKVQTEGETNGLG